MIKVCAMIEDRPCCIASFEDQGKADDFMKHDYILQYYDEYEDADMDEVIHPEEMFCLTEEEMLPFSEPFDGLIGVEADDLPF